MNLLNSPSRGNLVDGLPRAASDCWVGEYLNSNSGALGVPHGGSAGTRFGTCPTSKNLEIQNSNFF